MNGNLAIIVLIVFIMSLFSFQGVWAQNTQDKSSSPFSGDFGNVLRCNNYRFLITTNHSNIGVMKESSGKKINSYFFVAVSGFVGKSIPETTKDDTNIDENQSKNSIESHQSLPTEFGLSQNYPNPFNPTTTINFQIPRLNDLQEIPTYLQIFDIRGKLVKTLLDEKLSPGYYSYIWNGLNDYGEQISSGIYFYKIRAGDFCKSKKMLAIR